MDVNQVRFGNYSIGNPHANSSKKEEDKKENVASNAKSQNMPKMSADDFYSAMNIAGLQNKAQILNKGSLNSQEEIDALVAKYISPERKNDIEAMMGKFDNGVNQVKETLTQEFGNNLSPENKTALAAKIFASQE